MLSRLVLTTLVFFGYAGWELHSTSFFAFDFANSDGWTKGDGSTAAGYLNCRTTSMDIVYLDINQNTVKKTFASLPPHYQVKVIADLYMMDTWDGEVGQVRLGGTNYFNRGYNAQAGQQNLCGVWVSGAEIVTVTGTQSHTAASVEILFYTSIDQGYTDESFNFRNVQLWINTCHYTCLTCSGGNQNQCLTCYTGTHTSGVCPSCSTTNEQYFQPYAGCQTECDRPGFLANANKFCQADNRVILSANSFTWPVNTGPSATGWTMYTDGVAGTFRTVSCDGLQCGGKFTANEYIQKSFTLQATSKRIRITITYLTFLTWQQYASVWMRIGNAIDGIYWKGTGFTPLQSKIIFSATGTCSNLASDKTYTLTRTQLILSVSSTSLTIKIYGSQNQWAVRDFYLDEISCSQNCATCQDETNCQTCNGGYKLYKGTCISTCPVYSTGTGPCIDYDQETSYTKYLVKAFYSEETPDTEAALWTLQSSSGINEAKTVRYSYLPNKRIFGGALTWFNARYSRTLTTSAPHYAVRVRMGVVLGDDFASGQFDYTLAGSSYTITRASSATRIADDWGRTNNDYFYSVDRTISHTGGTFVIQFECVADSGKVYTDSWCGVYDLFITILECSPLCTACTSYTTVSCTAWISSSNFDSSTKLCKDGYESDYTTRSCVASYYALCGNKIIDQGETCDDGNLIENDGCYECQYSCPRYMPGCPIITPKTCNSGYLYSNFDNRCYSICGDKQVMGDEECDDGNLNPFDGCHMCKFSCQESCLECRNGQCYRCNTGFSLKPETGRCLPVCGDGVRSFIEVCDDKIFAQIDVCKSCEFSCPQYCATCNSYGLCSACQNGYDLNLVINQCLAAQGDAIIALGEDCDDSDLKPFDQCFINKFSCQESCFSCVQGKCLMCKPGWALGSASRCYPVCGDGVRAETEVCEDKAYNLKEFCLFCQFRCPDRCDSCDNFGICTQCQSGSRYSQTTNHCLPIINDLVIVYGESCDDGNLEPYDGCFNGAVQCQFSCLECQNTSCLNCKPGYELINKKCFPICRDLNRVEVEVCDDKSKYHQQNSCYTCQFQCPNFCKSCSYGVCTACQPGYILDPSTNSCFQNCGDKIVVGDEECDDGNLVPNDGCYECRYQCYQYCNSCEKGVCSTCKSGFLFNEQIKQCQANCGDGVRQDVEECDEKIYLLADSCFKCSLTCPRKCVSCSYGVCSNCDAGYWLNKADNLCTEVCGDKLTIGSEECDDGNITPYDGCYLCQFQCQPSCRECLQGRCQVCKAGYSLNVRSNRCETICGDGVLSETELCEDSFYSLKDVCHKCDFKCPSYCTTCTFGTCQSCETGYWLDNTSNKCTSYCGDNKVMPDEECDDGNLLAFDGCFECKIECQHSCIECRKGVCHKCKPGWVLNQKTGKCSEICGDNLIVGLEVCDNLNSRYYDGCQECKFSCSPRCTNCVYGICQACAGGFYLHPETNQCLEVLKDGVFYEEEQCDDSNLNAFDGCLNGFYSCQDSCLECRKGICYRCQSGWVLNSQMGRCLQICGDAVVVGNESCDDGNNLQYDTCYKCAYYCPSECTSCDKGVCLGCVEGLAYNLVEKRCYPVKGDGIVANTEICDDDNLVPFDHCLSYSYSCPENCQECYQGKCMTCKPGWIWNQATRSCQTKCGDMIRAGGEFCDDGNMNPLDGCHQCIFQCNSNCTECSLGICLSCQYGYQLIKSTNDCQPIRNDEVATNQEACDDGNLIPFDGCRVGDYECDYESCSECRIGGCWGCRVGWAWDSAHLTCSSICGDAIRVGFEQCDDGNLNDTDGCSKCRFKCPANCKTCSVHGRCQQCNLGFTLNSEDNSCSPICGDGLVVGNEECDEGRDFGSETCLGCKLRCTEGCKDCLNGICFTCKLGWELREGVCMSVCGDFAALEREECDDGNTSASDGCFSCKFQCGPGCADCPFGNCHACKLGWAMINGRCTTVCGDGMKMDSEWCDDGNFIAEDGCNQCNYLCPRGCVQCLHGQCLECEPQLLLVKKTKDCQLKASCDEKRGYYYQEEDNKCITKCGDMVVAGIEQCDDGNEIEHDGCFRCKYQCEERCMICNLGKCAACQIGFQLTGGKCIIQCGDGVLVEEFESCDDGNNVARDGCTLCRVDLNHTCLNQPFGVSLCFKNEENCKSYSGYKQCEKCNDGYFLTNSGKCIGCDERCESCQNSPRDCSKCVMEGCTKCESTAGLYTNYTAKSCFSKCGDFIRADPEECDDGNLINEDGCSSDCKVENFFQCGDAGCSEKFLPSADGDWVNSTTENVVKLDIEDLDQVGFCGNLSVTIEYFEAKDFAFNITDSKKCKIEFFYYKSIEPFNLIHIYIPVVWKSKRALQEEITSKEIILTPRKWVYYSNDQKQAADSTSDIASVLVILIRVQLIAALVSGLTTQFWGMLEILFWIHYIYLMNAHYPINIKNFLLHFHFSTIAGIPEFMDLNRPSDGYYYEPPPKFIEKKINTLFLENCQNLLFFFFIALGIYLLSAVLISVINKYSPLEKPKLKIAQLLTFNQQANAKAPPTSPFNPLRYLYDLAQNYKQSLLAVSLDIVQICILDLSLGIVFQFENTRSHPLVRFNTFLSSLTVLALLCLTTLGIIVCRKDKILFENLSYQRQFGPIFSEINTETPLAKYYFIINIGRKVLFMVFVVLCYEEPLIQTIGCCLCISTNILLLIFGNPFKTSEQLILKLGPMLCLTMVAIVSVGYVGNESTKSVGVDGLFNVGWFQLVMISFSIIIQVTYFIKECFLKIRSIFRPPVVKVNPVSDEY